MKDPNIRIYGLSLAEIRARILFWNQHHPQRASVIATEPAQLDPHSFCQADGHYDSPDLSYDPNND